MIIELACSKTPQSARAARKEEAKQVRLNATFFEDGIVIPGVSSSFSQHADKQIIKAGFNHLFNVGGAAPRVAKY